MSTDMTILELKNIVKRFGGTTALDGASLSVDRGEVHALLGENGSGKSTMMKIAAGIHRADEGEILFDTRTVHFRSAHAASQAGIAIVHQELNLVPVLSVAENVYLDQMPSTAWGTVKFDEMGRLTAELFRDLEIDISPWTRVEVLPVAMRQMVEIARALTRKIKLLILDEPTSALSESEVRNLFRIVKRLRADGTSVVYISHKMNEIFELANRYTVLRDGHTVSHGEMTAATESMLVSSMVGRQLGDYYPERKAIVPEREEVLPVLNCVNLTRRNGKTGKPRLHDISFKVNRGEIVGIAGLVGAGRTELLEILFGASREAWSGKIELNGTSVQPVSPAHAISLGIGLVTEDRGNLGLFRQQSVLMNATVAHLPELARAGVVSNSRERAALNVQSKTMQIRRGSDFTHIENLSGGNQQKVILARWLMTNPRLLLLDEPTRGIDVGAKAEIYRVLRGLADSGIGILFVSSEMPEVLGLADRILVMSSGRITAEFSSNEASEDSILKAAMM